MAKRHGRKRFYIVGEGVFGERNEGDVDGKLLIRAAAADAAAGAPGAVFLDQLRDGGGDLVNISSVAGRTARAGNASYAATKWGINGWSEALRQELQPDIRVIVIEPGAVATELVNHITSEAGRSTASPSTPA